MTKKKLKRKAPRVKPPSLTDVHKAGFEDGFKAGREFDAQNKQEPPSVLVGPPIRVNVDQRAPIGNLERSLRQGMEHETILCAELMRVRNANRILRTQIENELANL